MKNLKDYTDYLLKSGITKEEGEKLLREDNKLTDNEKLLIHSYVYPRRIGDYELPSHIQNFLGNNLKGTLELNHEESCILVEAYRSPQYGRFIRHLFHSYINPEKINPVEGDEIDKCPICGKKIYQYGIWQHLINEVKPGTSEKDNQEYLSWGSQESEVPICKDCLVQLIGAYTLIQSIEGEDFLESKFKKRTWDDLKL